MGIEYTSEEEGTDGWCLTHDEEGSRILWRETKGSVTWKCRLTTNISANGNGNAENVVQMSSLRAQHAAAAAISATLASAPGAPSNDSNAPSKNDDQCRIE